jgi:hypothetical protein
VAHEQPQVAVEPGRLQLGRELGGRADRRRSASLLGTVTAIEAIVRKDDRRPSKGPREAAGLLLLLDAFM